MYHTLLHTCSGTRPLPKLSCDAAGYQHKHALRKVFLQTRVFAWLVFFVIPLVFAAPGARAQGIRGGSIICAGTTATLSTANPGGVWQSGNTGVATVGSLSGTVSAVSPGTAIISYTISGTTDTIVLTVNAPPSAGAISCPATVCIMSSETLSETVSGGYWTANNGIATVGSATGALTGNAAGTDTILYTVSNSCGVATAAAGVTVVGTIGNIYTRGGNGTAGFSGDGGPACTANINSPSDLTTDNAGNIYFCDVNNNRVRKINRAGTITTVAGNGTEGNTGDGGQATAATLYKPNGVYVDAAGNVYVCNTMSNTVRKVNTTGVISTIAGMAGVTGATGDGGAATAAYLDLPIGITGDAAGNLYISDQGNNKVREIAAATGHINTVAGTGAAGYSGDGGPASVAELDAVRGIALDGKGNIYIADALNNAIRKYVPATGIITTFAGTGTAGYSGDGGAATAALLRAPARIAYDGANLLYITDQNNNVIRQVNLSTGIISRAAGNGTAGYSGDDNPADSGELHGPGGIGLDAYGNFYIADANNDRIRHVPSKGSVLISLGGSDSVFAGSAISFSSLYMGCGTVAYQWLKNNGNTGSGGASFTDYASANGDTYSLVLSVTPLCGSVFYDTSNSVSVTVCPVVSPVGGTTSICSGTSTTLTDTASGGLWGSLNTAVALMGTTGVVIGESVGTAVITYRLGTVCGITSTSTIVTVNAMDTINVSSGSGGSIYPGTIYMCGGNQVYDFNPDSGYHVSEVYVDGVDVGSVSSYTFSPVAGNHTLNASFALNCIPPSVYCGGSISQSADAGSCGALITYGAPTVTGTAPAMTYSQNSGTIFPVGVTTVTATATNACGVATCNFTVSVSANALTLSANGSEISCHGGSNGSITTSVGGGTGSYSYTWSGGASGADPTGLVAGTYSVTVSDAGCSAETPVSAVVALSQPAALTASSSVTNEMCNGANTGAVTVMASGGTPSYTGTGSFTGLAAGAYSYTVTDANGCSATTSGTITQPSALTATATVTNELCYGGASGAVSVAAAGGTTPYSGTGVHSGLSIGTYNYTVTDANGCTAAAGGTVTQPVALSLESATVTDITCHGLVNGAIDANVSGGSPAYSYTWSNGSHAASMTGLSVASYSVAVTDANGCTATGSFAITQPASLSLAATVVAASCYGVDGSVNTTVSGGATPYTYTWSNGANAANLAAVAGSYSVAVTDANGCGVSGGVYTIGEPTALGLAATTTNASCHGGVGTIVATVSGGTSPYSYSWTGGDTTATISAVAGAYSVTVTDAHGCAINGGAYTVDQPAAIDITGTITDETYHGASDGSIYTTVSGGAAPYSYLWTDGARTSYLTGLPKGTYKLTVTDSTGCTEKGKFKVTNPTNLKLKATRTKVACYGGDDGKIKLTVTGGTSPYTYAWSNGDTTSEITGLSEGTYSVVVTDAGGGTKTGKYKIKQPATAVTITGTVTNITCYGSTNGGVSTVVVGGKKDYTYLWSNSATTGNISGLVAGSYSVTVTDSKGCIAANAFTLSQPDSLSIASTITNAGCYGDNSGKVDITVSGGTTAYAYSWSNGATTRNATGLTAGVYSVTVTDAHSCRLTDGYSVAQPSAPLTVSATATNVSCHGGSNGQVTTTVAGGTAPYTYSWSNGATTANLSTVAAGTYRLTVTDANGCSATGSYTVAQPAAIAAAGVVTNAACYGANGNINTTVTGGTSPYAYSWSNSAATSGITAVAGSYSLTVTDAEGCSTGGSFSIAQPTALAIAPTLTNVGCYGGNTGVIDVTVSGGTTAYSYRWSNGSTAKNQAALTAGSYTVTVTDANSCTLSAGYNLTQPAGALDLSAVTANVSCHGGSNGAITTTVTGGTMAYSYAWTGGSSAANLSSLIAGTYHLTVTDANGCSATGTYTIAQPAASMGLTTTVTDAACYGQDGSAAASVTGGTWPYSYSWSNGDNTADMTTIAGTYSLTVTDVNGCATGGSYTITQPTPLAVSSTITNVACYGGSTGVVDITATGGTTPYAYSWSNGSVARNLTALAAGSYSLTVTDNKGCAVSAAYAVAQPSAALAVSGAVANVSCHGGSNGAVTTTVTGGTPAYSYAWTGGSSAANLTSLPAGTYHLTVTDANGCATTGTYTVTQPATNLGLSTTVTNASCYGQNGSAAASVTGGTTPYSYTWSNGNTTASITTIAGTYSLAVTDANACAAGGSYTITQPAALAVTSSVTNVACYGNTNGVIDVTVSGGTTPYVYNWSNGSTARNLTALAAGGYSVTVTDNKGCTLAQGYAVTQPTAALAVSGAVTNVSCHGGSNGGVVTTVAGGTYPYSYSWTSGSTAASLSSVAAGTYHLTVLDANSCNTTGSWVISQPAALSLSGTVTNAACNGLDGSISTTLTGGTLPYAYSWSSGATTSGVSAVAGTYTVTSTDGNGCISAAGFAITQPTVLSVTGSVTNVTCGHTDNGKIDITAAGGTTPYTYGWSNGSTARNQTTLTAGTYSVTVTDANSCATTGDWNVAGCSGRMDAESTVDTGSNQNTEVAIMQVKVYPNPNNGTFNVVIPAAFEEADIMVSDLTGRLVEEKAIKGNVGEPVVFYLGSAATGVYFVKINAGSAAFVQKVIKE